MHTTGRDVTGSPGSMVLSQAYASDEMLAELGFPTPYALCPMP